MISFQIFPVLYTQTKIPERSDFYICLFDMFDISNVRFVKNNHYCECINCLPRLNIQYHSFPSKIQVETRTVNNEINFSI